MFSPKLLIKVEREQNRGQLISNVMISFIRNATNTPVTMLAQGDVMIAGNISLNGQTPITLNSGGMGGPSGYNIYRWVMLNVRKTIFQRALTGLLLAIVCAVIPSLVMAQGTTSYVYDDNGRLHAVISPNGEAAVYEYDTAGNFTAIRRLTANDLALLSFSPHAGIPGDLVTFIGTGFGAGVNAVTFNGVSSHIVGVSLTTVVAEVPPGATTGPVTLTTPHGIVTTSIPFTVQGIRLIPPAASGLFPNQAVQFTATVVLEGDPSIKWSVNQIDGGNTSVGTITVDGLYTAPSLAISEMTATFFVRATSIAMPQVFAEAQVTVFNPEFTYSAYAPSVSVSNGSTSTFSTSPISIGVSVQNGSMLSTSSLSTGVSVQNGNTISISPLSTAVSATTGPNISTIAPNSIKAGTTATVTINGANLLGTTDLKFIDGNGALDSNIVASNINVNANGTTLTATLAVGGSDSASQRIVIVSTTSGHSLTSNVGFNTIEITP